MEAGGIEAHGLEDKRLRWSKGLKVHSGGT